MNAERWPPEGRSGEDNCLFEALSIAITGHGRDPLDYLVQPLSTVFWVDSFLRMRLATFAQADFDAPCFLGGLTADWRWATSIADFDRLLDQILASQRLAIVRAVAWPFSTAWRKQEPIMPVGERAAIVRSRNVDGYVVEDPLLPHNSTGEVQRSSVVQAATSGIALLDYRFSSPPPARAEVRALLETSLENLVRAVQPGRAPTPFGLAAIDHLGVIFDQRHLALYDSRHFRTMTRYYLPRGIRSFIVTNRDWFGGYCLRLPMVGKAIRHDLANAARAAAVAWEDTAWHLSRTRADPGGSSLQGALVDLKRAEQILVEAVHSILKAL
jgi:hypothetical protein